MSESVHNDFSKGAGAAHSAAEVTLRLIARLPAPEGLEDRVQAGLLAAPRDGRVLAWPRALPMAGGWMRGAAAAAIVCVVAGGGWGIYSRVQPARGIMAPETGGQFSTGEARRRPQTLEGPVVAPHPVTVIAPKPKAPVKSPGVKAVVSAQATAAGKTASPRAVQ
jgi:hypothetical protein